MPLREGKKGPVKRRQLGGGRGAPASAEQQATQIRILVVDDEATLRELLADALTEDGYAVGTASSGSEALERLRASGEEFDIIVTDLKLPGASGVEIVREARLANPQCAVIVMTGYATVESAVECMKAGALDYITKPLKLDEMRLIVERAGERLYLLREADKKKYYEELSRLDSLTHVFNHGYFHQLLAVELEEAKRFERPLCLFMIDVDDFKRVNDTFGHQVGDHALIVLARLLSTLTRQTDYVARYGGEEFAVVLPRTDKQRAMGIAERIRRGVAARRFQPSEVEESIRLTVSIGVAGYPEDAEESRELISKADKAFYAAKAAGKNCVKAF